MSKRCSRFLRRGNGFTSRSSDDYVLISNQEKRIKPWLYSNLRHTSFQLTLKLRENYVLCHIALPSNPPKPHSTPLTLPSMTPRRTIIAFGSGPGIGNHTVAEFASKGFTHAVLLSRNIERLRKGDAPFVAAANPDIKVDTLRLDLSDIPSIPAVLKQIEELTAGDENEVVFFNAARIKPSGVLDVSVEEIDEDFKVRVKLTTNSHVVAPLSAACHIPQPRLSTIFIGVLKGLVLYPFSHPNANSSSLH